jgi:hypothetical protein
MFGAVKNPDTFVAFRLNLLGHDPRMQVTVQKYDAPGG